MLIGIAGKARSGKDTIGDRICKNNPALSPYSFADPLKECMNEWLGWGKEHGWGALKEVTLPVSPNFYTLPLVIWKHFHETSVSLTMENCAQASRKMEDLLIVDERIYDPAVNTNTSILLVSPREIYQWFGTDCMRECVDEEFWLQIAPTEQTIIRDIRFENEADFIRDYGGTIIHVERTGLKTDVPDHASEAGIKTWSDDITLYNDGTMADLEKAVDEIVASIYKRQ